MRSADLTWVVMAIRIQRQVGGNLAEVLMNTVTTMRDRSQTRRHVRALSAEDRLCLEESLQWASKWPCHQRLHMVQPHDGRRAAPAERPHPQ